MALTAKIINFPNKGVPNQTGNYYAGETDVTFPDGTTMTMEYCIKEEDIDKGEMILRNGGSTIYCYFLGRKTNAFETI
jgi:hypothetical protein